MYLDRRESAWDKWKSNFYDFTVEVHNAPMPKKILLWTRLVILFPFFIVIYAFTCLIVFPAVLIFACLVHLGYAIMSVKGLLVVIIVLLVFMLILVKR
jgi:hypothetical protein